jgi:uncharacterized membrane protein YedE/YeeE
MTSLLGGALIGLSAALLLIGQGRIAGVSGILGDALVERTDHPWRLYFLGGLVAGGLALVWLMPEAFPASTDASGAFLMGAGLLVGFGTRLGGGCTSGHGICGLGRLSGRSLVAVVLFMASGAATVFVLRHLL